MKLRRDDNPEKSKSWREIDEISIRREIRRAPDNVGEACEAHENGMAPAFLRQIAVVTSWRRKKSEAWRYKHQGSR